MTVRPVRAKPTDISDAGQVAQRNFALLGNNLLSSSPNFNSPVDKTRTARHRWRCFPYEGAAIHIREDAAGTYKSAGLLWRSWSSLRFQISDRSTHPSAAASYYAPGQWLFSSLCLPHFDSPSVFAATSDDRKRGRLAAF